MKAVIMAGGFGTRLRPLTMNIPKPMVPMMNKPMMHHIVELLKRHGITDIIALLYHQPDIIISYFGDGSRFDTTMKYVRAEADYGTAGAVRNAAAFLDERFIIISGDVLTDFNLSKAINFHVERKAKATVVLTRAKNPLPFGVVITSNDGKITRFLEKPSWGEVFSDTINTGIYILEPEVLELVPYQHESDFSKNLFPLLLQEDLGLYGYIAEGYWRDIGNLNEYQEAHLDCLAGKVDIILDGIQQGSTYVGSHTVLKTAASNLEGTVVIGQHCEIGSDVKLANSVIGSNCLIASGAVIRNSIIWDGVRIGRGVELESDVVGSDCIIGEGAAIAENVFIGDQCMLGKGSKLLSNIKLWPQKVVEDGAVVSTSIVWGDKWLRELFTDARISGLSNIEMNPEFGAKLGTALGAFVGAGNTVVSSRDADNVSRMIKRALTCGLMSAGVIINDLQTTPIPIVRHELRNGKQTAGIHVRKSPYDKRFTDIIFFDGDGKDLPVGRTKAIERLFFGEDFARAKYDSVGSIYFPGRTNEIYRERFLSCLNVDAISKAGFRIVIDYSNGVASTIFPNILGSLSCQVVSLNAYLEPTKLNRSKDEVDFAYNRLSQIVTSIKYDVGFMIDAGVEKIRVTDEKGHHFDNNRLLTLVTSLVLEAYPHIRKIAVPVVATAEVDIVAKEHGVQVLRTKNSHAAMMDAVKEKDVGFVGGTKGGFIFPEFLFACDGMFGLAKILELLALTGKRLSELENAMPKLHQLERDVHCPWDAKGRVMRNAVKTLETEHHQLIDGIRILVDDIDWVLLLPDKERAVFHIYAEAEEQSRAEQLLNEYEEKVIMWRTGK